MDEVGSVFAEVFTKTVYTDSFRLPMSVKELRLLTERVVREVVAQVAGGRVGEWRSRGSTRELGRERRQSSTSHNGPIGLNSLSKTFNIIKVVGQGDWDVWFLMNLSGHFGRVFKAENKFDHRIFAIKQIKINPKEDLDKVLQEVQNLSKVGKNKNIVKYLDCFLVQEEWEEDEDDEEQGSTNSSYSNSQSFNHQTSSSFINFHQDASSLQMHKADEQVKDEEEMKEEEVEENEPEENSSKRSRVMESSSAASLVSTATHPSSPHQTSPHLTSPHPTSPHLTSPHLR